jgi:excisionase family DNA binding protein
MADAVKEAFAVKEICRAYGISRETVYNEIRRGRLRALKLGKKTIVLKSDAEAWRNSLPPLKLAARGEAPLPRGARRQPRRLPPRLAPDEAAIR